LGDHIAVLADGLLQQVGRPQDVYDDPDNLFVAGFIGSPPMNLLRGRASGGTVTAGDLELPVASVHDGEVVIGVRPESLHPIGEGDLAPCLAVLVDVVEPLGDEVLVHGSVDAAPAGSGASSHEADEATLLADLDGGRATVTLRLPPQDRPGRGSRLRVAVAPQDIRLFDPTSGLAIRPS